MAHNMQSIHVFTGLQKQRTCAGSADELSAVNIVYLYAVTNLHMTAALARVSSSSTLKMSVQQDSVTQMQVSWCRTTLFIRTFSFR